MKVGRVPLDTVINEWLHDVGLGSDEINYIQIKEWATDTIQQYLSTDQWNHKIVLLTPDRGQVTLPRDFKKLDQIAYRFKENKDDCTTTHRVTEWIQKVYPENCDLEVRLSCQDCGTNVCSHGNPKVEIDVDYIWMKQNPWYYTNSPAMVGPRSFGGKKEERGSYLDNRFKLMSYAGNSFFRLEYHLEGCENLTCKDCQYQYILELPYIKTDIPITKEAELLISYWGEPTDEKGDLYVPDLPDAREAIKEDLTYRYYRKRFLLTQNPMFQAVYQEARALSEMALGRARTKLESPESQEFRAFISRVWLKRVRNISANGTLLGKDPYDSYTLYGDQ
jgi:hypothetical protein